MGYKLQANKDHSVKAGQRNTIAKELNYTSTMAGLLLEQTERTFNTLDVV